MHCDEHAAPPRGRLGRVLSELTQWGSQDLVNLTHAIREIVDRRGSVRQPSLKQIKEAVAAASGLSVDDISSERRDRDVRRVRKVAMALCKHLTLAGYPRIGRAFGREAGAARRACRQLEPLVAFATKTLPPCAHVKDLALVMLCHYERIVGPD